jgi:xylulokinase
VSWDVVIVGASSRFGVPVFCAVGDQQAALFGAGLVADVVSVNVATGCQVSVLSSSNDSPAQLRPFFLDGVYLHTITHLPAGRLLAAAVRECRGSTQPVDWAWAAQNVRSDPRIELAVEAIAQGVGGAVDRLGVGGLPVLFSGGLVQQFAPVRERIIELLNVPTTLYTGDDAALAGLAALAVGIAP